MVNVSNWKFNFGFSRINNLTDMSNDIYKTKNLTTQFENIKFDIFDYDVKWHVIFYIFDGIDS